MESFQTNTSVKPNSEFDLSLLLESERRRGFLGLSEGELELLEKFCTSSDAFSKVDFAIDDLVESLQDTLERAEASSTLREESERIKLAKKSLCKSLMVLQQALSNTVDSFEACLLASLCSSENRGEEEESASFH